MVQTFTEPETISLEVPNSIALRVQFYRQPAEVEILINPAELSGEGVLPGFVLNLRRVWR